MFHTLGEVKNRARVTRARAAAAHRRRAADRSEADRIVCASQHEKQLLVRLYDADRRPHRRRALRRRPRPLPAAGQGGGAPRAWASAEERIILFVGRIEPLKGIDILINAAAQLSDEIRLPRADRRRRRRAPKRRRPSCGGWPERWASAERVCFPGRRRPRAAAAVLQRRRRLRRAVVLRELRAGGAGGDGLRHAGRGLARRRPARAPSATARRAISSPWRCPEPFAERLELLLDNEELRRNLGEGARAAAEDYAWPRIAERVQAVYDRLMAVHHAHACCRGAGDAHGLCHASDGAETPV